MKTSRQRLLEYIQAQHVVTSGDLSRALAMTPANARHHLAILVQQGLIEPAGERPASGKGRPATLYRLSEQALGHNLDSLADALLDFWLSTLPEAARPEVMRHLAERLAGASAPAGNLARRLGAAVQRLNEMHYQARWEAHAESPRLILGHCPYIAILPKHPELCQLDAFLLAALAGAPVTLTARLADDGRNGRQCLFRVG